MAARVAQLLVAGALSCALLASVACAAPKERDRDRDRARGTSWQGFGVGRWPSADWRPYADTAPFNRRIPAKVAVHPRSRAIVARALSSGPPAPLVAGATGVDDDWGHPTYYAKPSDPRFRLDAVQPWGRNKIEGHRIPIPDAARPAAGGDAHMTVVTPEGWEYDFWDVRSKPPGGGTLTFGWGGRVRIDGSGIGSGGTASGFANLAGMIRAQELEAGRIDHALFLVLSCTGSGRGFGFSARDGHVHPARAGGTRCGDDRDAAPMGTRFQLAMSAREIEALPVPRWKQAILLALARYGAYVGDTGGPGFGFMLESSTTYTSFGWPDPLVAFADRVGVPASGPHRVLDIASGVDWASRLRVVAPPRR